MEWKPRPITGPVVFTPRPVTAAAPKHPNSRSNRKVWGPKSLNDELVDQLCKLIEKGLPLNACCDYLGLDQAYFQSWMKMGENFLKGQCEPPHHEMYGHLVRSVRTALAKYELTVITRMQRSGNRNWFRDLCVLERRDRRNFGKYEQPGGGEESFNPDEKFL